MIDYMISQANDVLPPRTGVVVALGIDGTSRPYQISTLDYYGNTAPTSTVKGQDYYLSLYADGNDVYINFGAATLTVDDTAKVSAGSALAFTANACFCIPKGTTSNFRIRRDTDLWFAVKCSGSNTATLRYYGSSPNAVGATQ